MNVWFDGAGWLLDMITAVLPGGKEIQIPDVCGDGLAGRGNAAFRALCFPGSSFVSSLSEMARHNR